MAEVELLGTKLSMTTLFQIILAYDVFKLEIPEVLGAQSNYRM
jgi:hypothetical protein